MAFYHYGPDIALLAKDIGLGQPGGVAQEYLINQKVSEAVKLYDVVFLDGQYLDDDIVTRRTWTIPWDGAYPGVGAGYYTYKFGVVLTSSPAGGLATILTRGIVSGYPGSFVGIGTPVHVRSGGRAREQSIPDSGGVSIRIGTTCGGFHYYFDPDYAGVLIQQ